MTQSSDDLPLFEPERLRAALDLDDAPSESRDLMRTILDATQREAPDAIAHLGEADPAQRCQIAHRLKSRARLLGLTRFAHDAADLEEDSRERSRHSDGDSDPLAREAIDHLRSLFERSIVAVDAWLAALDPIPPESNR